MRKTFALLFTLTLAASCAEQEVLAPVGPTAPNSGVQIVPGLSIGASGSAEVNPWSNLASGMRDTHATTRATSYPYLAKNADGKNSVIVTKDAAGQMAGVRFHYPWFQTPQHLDASKDDAVSARFEVAQENGGVFQIGDNTACPAPWRRPTVREWYVITLVKNNLEVSPFDQQFYLTATETQLGKVGWCDRYANWKVFQTELTNLANVRCVRDIYPYVAPNADGKMSVIVSNDEQGTSGAALHAPWTQTPPHITTAPENSVSYRFEVRQEDIDSKTWGQAQTACPAPWRVPTYEELKAIYWNRDMLEVAWPDWASHGDNRQHWSATEYSGDANQANLIDFHTGAFYQTPKEGYSKGHVRCVRDLYDNFPNATGSNVATMWGYTATTGLKADNLVPPTAIKNTATGFELETSRYYPVDGSKKLYFYAHAPHDGGVISNVDNATVTYDILGQTDVLWAKDDRGIAKNVVPSQQGQPFFLFQHKLMRLAFKVVADASYPANKTVTKITVKNVNTKVVMTIPTGATTFNTPGDISITPATGQIITPDGTTLKEVLMTAPNSTVTLVVEAGGATYPEITLPLTGEGAGTAGVSHLAILTFKQNLIVPSMVIIPWDGGDGGEGELI